MKHRVLAIATLVLVPPAFALDGDPRMHDPSTVVLHDGKFYSNGGGATDFCARFLDGEYRPFRDIRVTLADR